MKTGSRRRPTRRTVWIILICFVFQGVMGCGGKALTGTQPAGTIHGRVVDFETTVPMEGAVIELLGTGHRAVADSQGNFDLEAVPAGTHHLLITREAGAGGVGSSYSPVVKSGVVVEDQVTTGLADVFLKEERALRQVSGPGDVKISDTDIFSGRDASMEFPTDSFEGELQAGITASPVAIQGLLPARGDNVPIAVSSRFVLSLAPSSTVPPRIDANAVLILPLLLPLPAGEKVQLGRFDLETLEPGPESLIGVVDPDGMVRFKLMDVIMAFAPQESYQVGTARNSNSRIFGTIIAILLAIIGIEVTLLILCSETMLPATDFEETEPCVHGTFSNCSSAEKVTRHTSCPFTVEAESNFVTGSEQDQETREWIANLMYGRPEGSVIRKRVTYEITGCTVARLQSKAFRRKIGKKIGCRRIGGELILDARATVYDYKFVPDPQFSACNALSGPCHQAFGGGTPR